MTARNWLRCAMSLLAVPAIGLATPLIAAIIPYTYSYDPSSVDPAVYPTQGETEANPHILNDGVTALGVSSPWETGKGLQLWGGQQTNNCPAITLTLDQSHTNLDSLTVYYYGGGDAGVHAPASLTVSDASANTTTVTNFNDAGTSGVYSLNVPISSLSGQTLHLTFTNQSSSYWLGLSEIQVFTVTPTWVNDADGNWSSISNWSVGTAPMRLIRERCSAAPSHSRAWSWPTERSRWVI